MLHDNWVWSQKIGSPDVDSTNDPLPVVPVTSIKSGLELIKTIHQNICIMHNRILIFSLTVGLYLRVSVFVILKIM